MSFSQRLVRDVFQPLILWQAGDYGQIRWLREFERTQYLSAEGLRRLQTERLRALLRHAWEQCPFYRARMEAANFPPERFHELEDLHQLPLVEKKDIQNHRDDMVARTWPRRDLLPNQTGGSTGTPISFYLSHERHLSRAAATIRHNRWAGWDVGDRLAVLWGAPQDTPRQDWRARLRQALLGRPLWLDTAHVTEARLHDFHRALHEHRPRIVQAYARSLLLFAQFLEAQRLRAYRPQSIVISAEGLEPHERALIERVFGCPLFNRYGCREVSVIASECSAHEGLHTMAEGLYVEIVVDGRPARPGERGSILITDLLNLAMPLIRYRIGDVGSWAEGVCACGRALPRLRSLEGRVTDFVVGADGRLVSGVFLATYVVAQRPSLGQVQIEQHRTGEVLYRIRPGRDFNHEEDLAYLKKTSRQYLGEALGVQVELVEEIPAEASGKFLFSRSTIAPAYLR